MISHLVEPLEALRGSGPKKLDSGDVPRISERLPEPRETLSRLLSMSGAVRVAEYSRGFPGLGLFDVRNEGPIPVVAEPAVAVQEIHRIRVFAESRIAGLRAAAGGRLARVSGGAGFASDIQGATPATGLSRFKAEADVQVLVEGLTCLAELEEGTSKKKKDTARGTAAAGIAGFVSEPYRALLLKNIKSVRGELEVVRIELGQTMMMLGGAFKAVLELDSVFRGAVAGKVGKHVVAVVDGVERCLAETLEAELQGCASRADVLSKVPGWFTTDGTLAAYGRNLLRLGDGLLELEFEDLEALLSVASEYAAALEGELLSKKEDA